MGAFLPPCHWEGPKSAPAAVRQETLWVALRHSWTGPYSLNPLEISGVLLLGAFTGQGWVSLPFLLSSPGASRITDESLTCEAPHTPSFLPYRLCFLHPGFVLLSSFLLATKSQPQKADFPCVCPELSVLLGITLALVFFSGSHCPCLWCHHCAHGTCPPTSPDMHSHRTARANARGRRPGPG